MVCVSRVCGLGVWAGCLGMGCGQWMGRDGGAGAAGLVAGRGGVMCPVPTNIPIIIRMGWGGVRKGLCASERSDGGWVDSVAAGAMQLEN